MLRQQWSTTLRLIWYATWTTSVPRCARWQTSAPDIDSGLAWVTVAPFGQNVIDSARGDYMNLFVVLDLTRTRLKRDLLNGTRFGNTDLPLVPAPGDPGYETFYARNPLGIPIAPLPADELPAAAPMPPGAEPESIPPVPQGAGG